MCTKHVKEENLHLPLYGPLCRPALCVVALMRWGFTFRGATKAWDTSVVRVLRTRTWTRYVFLAATT